MERIVRKMALNQAHIEADREVGNLSTSDRMDLFEELLRLGRAFYPENETTEGYPRAYRVVALRES